jgi:hypothetical protein
MKLLPPSSGMQAKVSSETLVPIKRTGSRRFLKKYWYLLTK